MLTEEERQAIVTYRLEKAENALKQVEANIANEFWDLIANRLYYAAYYAVTALLISENHETHTHNGVITMFELHFVKLINSQKKIIDYTNVFSHKDKLETTVITSFLIRRM